MAAQNEQLLRVFQANLDRLFVRVIQPTMDALALYPVLKHGEATRLDGGERFRRI
ncbi:hypothetical protein G6L13_24815 [Agrobacterium tumefaciens]|uniref:hypothetical protein n=1 Tax=Agrobacterium tumefaciens TaxID=358 RepID=UPI00157499E8|nr:hypothetical protein [Agrobacterium tumefaciens]NTA83722.1 hypothetical protein [Agrobacterium tumefaciens]